MLNSDVNVLYQTETSIFYIDTFLGSNKKKPELQHQLDTDQVFREKRAALSSSVFQFTQKAMTFHVSDI